MRSSYRHGLAVGFFDGVHLGHRAILANAAGALTFINHPLTVLAPDRAPRLLMTPEARVAAIKACGVREVAAVEFTRELAEMSAGDFARRHLAGRGTVYCGENWRFGRGGEGCAGFLASLGIHAEVVSYASHGGCKISSTRIRAALEAGDMADASAMLGRPWSVPGEVFRGKGFGSSIGFPTLNMRLPVGIVRPPLGVYIVESCGVTGVANYGMAPTMGVDAWPEPVLEVHFPGMGAAPGEGAFRDVAFIRFLRPERRFGSVEELRRQISEDCGIIKP